MDGWSAPDRERRTIRYDPSLGLQSWGARSVGTGFATRPEPAGVSPIPVGLARSAGWHPVGVGRGRPSAKVATRLGVPGSRPRGSALFLRGAEAATPNGPKTTAPRVAHGHSVQNADLDDGDRVRDCDRDRRRARRGGRDVRPRWRGERPVPDLRVARTVHAVVQDRHAAAVDRPRTERYPDGRLAGHLFGSLVHSPPDRTYWTGSFPRAQPHPRGFGVRPGICPARRLEGA